MEGGKRMSENTIAKAAIDEAPKAREAEVLAAAVAIFNSRGYAATSISDIANSLGIRKGSVYYYIDSKEDLLFRTLLSTSERIERVREEAASPAEVDPLKRLRAYVVGQTAFVAENMVLMGVYYREMRHLSAERADELRAARRKQIEFVEGLILEAQKAGTVGRFSDHVLLTKFILSLITGVINWYHLGDDLPPRELGLHVWNHIESGLRTSASHGA
ncbi:TetR/AcrR family transcriptional regulator [Rhodococcus opacus]|jgi:AcrR family transcriptional regulator|uniref:TetR/AcrR family transcriptional regulator n=1 Tax=Rhodococcus opacus TaxID=37919 RepID=UPI002475E1B5|nr:TetR/AcrR family transcriptional regulator [Rhodococcus opacus]MDH6293403.1 AcrR family transcriptional regulator [Rhodococcus opacus]